MEAMYIALSIKAILMENGVDTFRWLQDYSQERSNTLPPKALLSCGKRLDVNKTSSLSDYLTRWG